MTTNNTQIKELLPNENNNKEILSETNNEKSLSENNNEEILSEKDNKINKVIKKRVIKNEILDNDLLSDKNDSEIIKSIIDKNITLPIDKIKKKLIKNKQKDNIV